MHRKFLFRWSYFLKTNKQGDIPGPTQIKIGTLQNETADFTAELIPSADNNYTFMSSNTIASLTTFHFLDTANDKPIQIELSNNKLSLYNKWLIETSGSEESIKNFKKTCSLIAK